MNTTSRRRWVASVTAPVLILVGPGLLPISSSAAPVALAASAAPSALPRDHRPAAVGADWLAGQLSDEGLLHYDEFGGYDDYGLSIDAAFALDRVGGHQADVDRITDAVAAHIGAYAGAGSEIYAGSTGKAVSLATSQGRDPRSFGGYNLVARLNATVQTDGAVRGRIMDSSQYGDYANVFGQAYAVRGLHAAGSRKARSATRFLLAQQCAAGWFRLSFTPSLTSQKQSCDSRRSSVPDPDATALSVLALLDQQDRPKVDAAITAASRWLRNRQQDNGALGGGTSTEKPNTNSTGLAGWVFGETGRRAAATKAAGWVRARQADDAAPCDSALSTETGAIGYDAAAVRTGRAEGITTETTDQWRRAASQALPALLWSPAAVNPRFSGPDGYVRGGSTVAVRLAGVARGSTVCVSNSADTASDRASQSGRVKVALTWPKSTGAARVAAAHATGVLRSTRVQVLGRLTIEPRLAKDIVRRGGEQTVTVTGLAARERVRFLYRGDVVAEGRTGKRGKKRATFEVGHKAGGVTVTVLGEFGKIRRGSADFLVR